MEKIKKFFNINFIIEIIFIIMLFFLAIKKGGFYIADSYFFNITIVCMGIFSIIYNLLLYKISNGKKYYILHAKDNKIDYIFLNLLLLGIAYILPVIFKNCTSYYESFFEFLRYINILLVYLIIKNSDYKKMYIYAILSISFILCLLGIDQIAGKYVLNLLRVFNSGYLTLNNITRMSSTIQYANVFSLICAVCYFIIFEKKLKCANGNKYIYIIYNIFSFTFLSSIILSASRYTILLLFVIYIIYTIKYRNNSKHIILNYTFDFIYVLIYTGIINNLQYINFNLIYFVYTIALLLYTLLKIYFNKFFNKVRLNMYIIIIIILVLVTYFLISVNIKIPVYLEYGMNDDKLSRNIYTEDKNININLELDLLESDTRYNIVISKIDKNNETKSIERIYYFSSPSSNYNINVCLDNLDKGINITVNIQKGKLRIDNILLNGRRKGLNYILIPSDIVYRVNDGLNSSNNFLQRIDFAKDAIKIIKSSKKNFFVGVGGEGFKNLYKDFRSYNYNSTEVHNVYLQIFVESGIVGFLSFLFLNVLLFKKSNNKILILLFLLHFILDLDFSYMFMMCFYIIIATCNLKEKNEKVF